MKLRSTVPALALAGLLVLAVNPAGVSAAAKNLVLGRSNSESRTTTLTNTGKGPALSLRAKPGKAALKVSSTAKVARLNADLVDGVDASALGTSATVYTMPLGAPTTSIGYLIPLDPGHYQVSYSAALQGATNGVVDCWLQEALSEGIPSVIGESRFIAGASYAGLTGTGLVEQVVGGSVTFNCYAAKAFTTAINQPIQIVVTPITTFSDGGVVSPNARAADRPAHH